MIRIDGQPHNARQSLDNVGALNELPSFYSAFTGRKNMEMLLRGASKKYTRESLDKNFSKLDILEQAGKRVRDYSKGMRTRLGITQVLARNGRIYIFDEPGTGLDPVGISFVRDLMRSLADSGGAVLFSSHILSEVEAVCDRVAMIHKGHILAFDTLDKIRHLGLDKERFSVAVATSDLSKATKLLTSKFGDVVMDDDGHLVVAADSGGDVNRALFEAGIVANAITPNTNALDATFRGLIDNTSSKE